MAERTPSMPLKLSQAPVARGPYKEMFAIWSDDGYDILQGLAYLEPASLFVAAPDLFRMLRKARNYLTGDLEEVGDEDAPVSRLAAEIDAVLAKVVKR